MLRYSPSQLAQSPVLQHRAEQTRNLVETVFRKIQSKDGSANDRNLDKGAVSFREDGFEFSGTGPSLRYEAYSEVTPGSFSADPAIGKCVATMEGNDVISAVKVIGADVSSPSDQRSIGEGHALAFDLTSSGGLGWLNTYSVENTKNGSRLIIDRGTSLSRVEIDAKGQLVEFSVGKPTFLSRLRDKFC